jgi:hypothetical protein
LRKIFSWLRLVPSSEQFQLFPILEKRKAQFAGIRAGASPRLASKNRCACKSE